MSSQPNVLFIISDQHNAKVLGHAGHPTVRTPNLDRLAAEGVRFTRAISQSPICTPARVSYFSGQYVHNHGYYGLGGPNPEGLPTMLGHFRRFGYRTAAVGKIHCPEYWVEDDCDFFREVCDCSIGGCGEYTAHLAERGLLDKRDDLAYPEFGPRGRQSCDARPSEIPYEDSPEGWVVRQVMHFMGRCADEGKPFIVQASLPKPHQIYSPAKEFWEMYDEDDLVLPPNADYDMAAAGKAPHLRAAAERWRKGEWALFEPRTFEAARLRKLHGYLGCVSHMDHAVGELLDWLDDAGLAEDTIVIYCADHGDYACEHGNMEKAPGICSDAITRVPFLWRWPGHFAAGHVVEQIVEQVDLPTTLCALCDLEPMETSDGADLSELLAGGHEPVHHVGVTEFAWSKSLRRDNYRLVYYPPQMFPDQYPDGFGELYDLEADPWEMKNLYLDPDYADLACELRGELLDWLVTTSRPGTVLPMPPLEGWQFRHRHGASVNSDNKFSPRWLRHLRGKNYL
ncbi:MAG: sulfatase-like hydrolase/transferase [Armatimonadetes bacterium]|nr:sulfatase-like hydrolase/transferase [Armatimonadota bacterium]